MRIFLSRILSRVEKKGGLLGVGVRLGLLGVRVRLGLLGVGGAARGRGGC